MKRINLFLIVAFVAGSVAFVGCDKDMENLLEIVKNENGYTKAVYDEQNRITKIFWYDKDSDVYKKTSFTYSDDVIRLKVEKVSHDEYLAIGEYTVLDDNIIKFGGKKIVMEFEPF